MSKPTLYGIWLSGPTYKVGQALAMLGVAHAYRHVDLRAGAHKQPEYLAINRYGQVPALVEGDVKLCQSDAILLHLADKHGKLDGKNAAERANVREWLFWEFDRLAPNVYRTRAAKKGFLKADEATLATYKSLALDALKVLDGHLAGRAWLVGAEPTIADIAVYGDVIYAGTGEAELDMTAFPNVTAWMERFSKLPGVKHPYDLLPKENRD
jgi:glutathione S-transferase